MRIPVIGIGVISALGIGVEENLTALREGRTGIDRLTLFESIHNVPVGEVKYTSEKLKEILGLNKQDSYSRTALLGICAADLALRDAGLETSSARVGLISATSVGGMDLTENFYKDFLSDETKGRLRDVKSHDCADSTLQIARYCGIKGFTSTISTACSSAANAIMLGARMLESNMLDYVVVGGTDALCKFTLNGFRSLMILDSNRCRPFDETRAGLNLGEGAAYLVLCREELVANNDPYCFLTGFSNTNDAFHQTATSSDGEGATRSMRGALKKASLRPDEIGYVNVHGTGTFNNDASEGAALKRVFTKDIPPFSSTKAFTGHTLAAAGGIEAVYAVLSLKHGLLYPNLNYVSSGD